MYEKFLFSDVYNEIENIININLYRKDNYLILEKKYFNKIIIIIKQSIWYKYIKKTFNLNSFIKKIMILDKEDKLLINKGSLLIKKIDYSTKTRELFRTFLSSYNINKEVNKYLYILEKKEKKEIFNVINLFKYEIERHLDNKNLINSLISYYYVPLLFESLKIIYLKKLNNFKINNSILNLKFLKAIYTLISIIDINIENNIKLKTEMNLLKINYKEELLKLENINKNLKNNEKLKTQLQTTHTIKLNIMKSLQEKIMNLNNQINHSKLIKKKKLILEKDNIVKELRIIEKEEEQIYTEKKEIEQIFISLNMNFKEQKNICLGLNIKIKKNKQNYNSNEYLIKQKKRLINYKIQMFFFNL